MCFLILSSKSVLPENRLFSFNAAFFFVTSHSAKVSASSKRTCRSEILLLPFCNKLANLKEEEGEKEPKTYLSNCLSAGSILITSSSPASSPSAASAASLMTLFQIASAPGKALTLKVNMATSPGPALNSSAPEISGGNWISNEA